MARDYWTIELPLLSRTKKKNARITLISPADFKSFAKKRTPAQRRFMDETGFKAQKGQSMALRGAQGALTEILLGWTGVHPGEIEGAQAAAAARSALGTEALKDYSFEAPGLESGHGRDFALGWVMACQDNALYRKNGAPRPMLVTPPGTDKKTLTARAEALMALRRLITEPANKMGPAELEDAARTLATRHKAAISVISGAKLQSGFPLVHAVGQGSPRAPRLIEMRWGAGAKSPLITLVGKGVCFDTGGLNLKPGSAMASMKKDMGGAAHVLALAHLIMSARLKVRLRVLVPAVENAVGGAAYRPGDVFISRKGISVENTNTDAEGRLILADALAYACEGEQPDLLVDFATLTGSARAALGPDIPALFSTDDTLAQQWKEAGFSMDDPVWPMPLWAPYRKHLDSAIADCVNSASLPGDTIYSALFLQQFITPGTRWAHVDCHAWELSGRPGRPKGGADNGLRSLFTVIQQRYA